MGTKWCSIPLFHKCLTELLADKSSTLVRLYAHRLLLHEHTHAFTCTYIQTHSHIRTHMTHGQRKSFNKYLQIPICLCASPNMLQNGANSKVPSITMKGIGARKCSQPQKACHQQEQLVLISGLPSPVEPLHKFKTTSNIASTSIKKNVLLTSYERVCYLFSRCHLTLGLGSVFTRQLLGHPCKRKLCV